MFAPQAAVSLTFHLEYKVLYFLNNNNNNSNEGTLSLVKGVCERERYYEGWCNNNAAYFCSQGT
jgi:hypothetical protein